MHKQLLGAAIAPPLTTTVSAQDAASGVTTSADGTTVSYDARFFSQYSPIAALDMLRWIPGTADIVPEDRFGGGGGGGGQERGFGSSGDQILINDKHLSGKSNDIVLRTELRERQFTREYILGVRGRF